MQEALFLSVPARRFGFLVGRQTKMPWLSPDPIRKHQKRLGTTEQAGKRPQTYQPRPWPVGCSDFRSICAGFVGLPRRVSFGRAKTFSGPERSNFFRSEHDFTATSTPHTQKKKRRSFTTTWFRCSDHQDYAGKKKPAIDDQGKKSFARRWSTELMRCPLPKQRHYKTRAIIICPRLVCTGDTLIARIMLVVHFSIFKRSWCAHWL